MVLVGTVLALLVAALVLSLVELGGDPQPVAKAPDPRRDGDPRRRARRRRRRRRAHHDRPAADARGGRHAGPGATPRPPTPAPGAEPRRADAIPTPGGTTPGAGAAASPSWPEGKTAWTVIIASTGSRAEAEKKARAAGADAGVLNSDDFSSLRKGYWVVFAGQYANEQAAQSAAEGKGGDAYARRVVPR